MSVYKRDFYSLVFANPVRCTISILFWRRGDPKTDQEAIIIYLLAGFFGSKSQSTFLIFNTSLERLFSVFWKKRWGGGEA